MSASPWPYDNVESLERFYGTIDLGPDGRPSPSWEARNLISIVAPYPMMLSWKPEQPVLRIRCHRLLRESLLAVFDTIKLRFPTDAARAAAGLNLFGGVYEYRRIGGSERLSVHSFGAAIDIDPGRNPRGKPWAPGMMPLGVVGAFESQGWEWGGRWSHKPDCQHFQAAHTWREG